MKTQDIDTASQLAYIDLEVIATSKTNTMFRDPGDFSPASLKDLVDSITSKGVIQPILLRPAPEGHAAEFIIVAGERRVKAARLVAQKFPTRDTIPAFIREMTEAEALELQIVENLQRENVNPMREALGFELLVKQKKYSTSTIAAKLGKSIDYVQERIRLCQLIAPIQDLVRTGEIPIKAGLKMARIPSELQKECLAAVTNTIDLGDKKRKVVFDGLGPLQEWLDDHLWLDLDRADFDKEDPNLNPPQGACSTCPHRSRNTAGLFDDLTAGDKCMLPACYHQKQINTYQAQRNVLLKKYPGKDIQYRERHGSIKSREVLLKQLGEIKSDRVGQEISEKEFLKDPAATANVLVGVTWYRGASNEGKTLMFTKPRQTGSKSTPRKDTKGKALSPQAAARAEAKEKQKQEQGKLIDAFRDILTAKHILEYKTSDKIYASLLRGYIAREFNYADTDILVCGFHALGLDWYEKGKLHKAKDTDLVALLTQEGRHAQSMTEKDLERSLQGVKELNDLAELVFIAFYHGADYDVNKTFNLKPAEITKKANSMMQSWWTKRKALPEATAAAGGKVAKNKGGKGGAKR